MSHDYHEALPGFSAGQILHDGCGECEYHAKSGDHGLASLDRERFVLAWERAARWTTGWSPDISYAEMPMLRVLWAVQVQLQNRGVEIGRVPRQDGW